MEYFDPARRLYGPVAAVPVTFQPPDPRQFNVDIQVRGPKVPILLVFADDVSWQSLVPILGRQGVDHARQSTGGWSPYVPAAVQLTGEHGEELKRQVEFAHFWNGSGVPDNAHRYRYCVIPPGLSPGIRFEQKVLPSGVATDGRFRLRVAWIELRGTHNLTAGAGIQCDAGVAKILRGPYQAAEVKHIDALARDLDVSLGGIATVGLALIAGVILIAGS